MPAELVPASSLEDELLAELFTSVYAGYWHPIAIDAPALRRMITTYDLDLAASVVAVDHDAPVGLGMLALRGSDAWVGGMGVLPEHRGRGLGEAIMRALVSNAATRRATRVRLEVLEQNEHADRIYRRVGFQPVRDVAVWRIESGPDDYAIDAADDVDLSAALGDLAESLADAPWQRSARTIANMRTFGATLHALRAGDATGIYATAGDQASLLALEAGSIESGLAALRVPFARGARSLLWLNGPTEGVAADAMRQAGASILGRQHELALALSP